MAALIVVLRAMHIVGGVFWAGGAMALNFFVFPSANATRPDSARFTQHLARESGLVTWMTIASLVTLVGGLALFSPVTGTFDRDVMRSPHGIVLSLGALIAIGAYVEGLLVVSPAARRLGALGAKAAAAGGPPAPELLAEIEATQAKLGKAGRRGAIMLGTAALCMAIARYL